jgi:glycosidase
MQWDGSRFAEFSEVEPWPPLAEDFRQHNTITQHSDPSSISHLYRRLTALRRSRNALRGGSYIVRSMPTAMCCWSFESKASIFARAETECARPD